MTSSPEALQSASPSEVGPSGATSVRSGRALLLILVVGAVVRLALWGWFQGLPPRIWDEKDYDKIAKNLVLHGEYAFEPGTPTSLRPPLYPTFVAGVYALFGVENYQAVRLIQAALSLVTVWILYLLGREVASERVALWLAGLYCFYPSMLGFNNLILTEVMFTLWLTAACYAVARFYVRGGVGWLALAGVLLGLAALTRSVVWLAPPFLAGYVLLTWKGPLRYRLLAPVALLLAFAATLAPWSIRNSRLEKTFVAVDTMGGRNFMMGNYQHTPRYRSWDAISFTDEKAWHHEVRETYPPEQRTTQGKVDKLALKQGLAYVRANPCETAIRDTIKFFDFWGLERELVAGTADGFFGKVPRGTVPILGVVIVGSYAAALFLGIFGMVLTPVGDRRLHWFFLMVIAFVCGMHTLVFGHSRYHLPLMPLVLLYAASAVANAPTLWQQRKRLGFWVAGGLCVLFVAGWVWGVVAGDWERLRNALGLA